MNVWCNKIYWTVYVALIFGEGSGHDSKGAGLKNHHMADNIGSPGSNPGYVSITVISNKWMCFRFV